MYICRRGGGGGESGDGSKRGFKIHYSLTLFIPFAILIPPNTAQPKILSLYDFRES